MKRVGKLIFFLLVTFCITVIFGMAFTASATSSIQETEFNKYLFVLPGVTESGVTQQRNVCFAVQLPGVPDIPGITFELAGVGEVNTTSGMQIAAYIAQNDFDDKTLDDWDQETLEQYDVRLIYPGTARYNCHSYAWHQAADDNIYYVGIISTYLRDPHCTEVSNARVGAIAVYCDAGDKPLHSAIVTSVAGSVVTCQSKWGVCGVFEHELGEVPDEYTANGNINVKYYVYEKFHTYSDADTYTETHHTLTCTICEYETTVQHSYTVTHTAETHTRSCRFCDWSVTEPHEYDLIKAQCTVCGRFAGNTPVLPFLIKKENLQLIAIGGSV